MKYIITILAIVSALFYLYGFMLAIKLNQAEVELDRLHAELESEIYLKELAQSSANYYYYELSSN